MCTYLYGAFSLKQRTDEGLTAAELQAVRRWRATVIDIAIDEPLCVTPTRNGPLEVQGNMEVISGTGRTVARLTKTWLCRCGGSKKKPYCDGSHCAIGFTADGT